jgi:hypothetical protein
VVGAEPAELSLAGGDLAVELVDEAQARLDGAGPGLGKRESLEERAPRDAEQVGHRAGRAVREQDRVHPPVRPVRRLRSIAPATCSRAAFHLEPFWWSDAETPGTGSRMSSRRRAASTSRWDRGKRRCPSGFSAAISLVAHLEDDDDDTAVVADEPVQELVDRTLHLRPRCPQPREGGPRHSRPHTIDRVGDVAPEPDWVVVACVEGRPGRESPG